MHELSGMREHQQMIPYDVVASARVTSAIHTLQDLGFVPVPAGTLRMGDTNGQADERPVNEVPVAALRVMDHELTLEELYAILDGDSSGLGRGFESTLPSPDAVIVGEPSDWYRVPVSLSFSEARNVAGRTSRLLRQPVRLPTEAEWEYAARGGLIAKDYPWGDESDTMGGQTVSVWVARIVGDCPSEPMQIRSAKAGGPPNGYSLFDVAGNVWEWTSTEYRPYPYSATDGREEAGDSALRVIRGGGASQEACTVRVAFRGYADPSNPGSQYGVRFVVSTQ